MRRAVSGRSKPPLVIAEMPDGTPIEVWLKSPKLHDGISDDAPAREWMAARLAEDLDLPCAPPVLVRVTGDFIASLQDEELAECLDATPPVAFGSMHLGPGWRRWSEAAKMPRSKHRVAGMTYLFDTIIQNWDRRKVNPNILKKGSEFRLIDHEEAFAACSGDIDDRPYARFPWSVGGINNYISGGYQHPFWQFIKRSGNVNFSDLAGAWKSLPQDTFSLYANDAPVEWGPDTCRDIAAYLDDAVRNIDDIIAAIEGARGL